MKFRTNKNKFETLSKEAARHFFIKRPFLAFMMPKGGYESLKARDGKYWASLSHDEKLWFTGFICGYLDARRKI